MVRKVSAWCGILTLSCIVDRPSLAAMLTGQTSKGVRHSGDTRLDKGQYHGCRRRVICHCNMGWSKVSDAVCIVGVSVREEGRSTVRLCVARRQPMG